MKIFISWSGPRSLAAGEAFRDWLPRMINAVHPFLSPHTEKGARWRERIAEALTSDFGVVCLTPENRRVPWLLYEAGALSKARTSRLWTLLLGGLTPADVEPPLGDFQHTVASDKGDVLKLVQSINTAVRELGETPLDDRLLERQMDALWPELDAALGTVSARDEPAKAPSRPDRQVLEEVLETVRAMQSAIAALPPYKPLPSRRRGTASLAASDPSPESTFTTFYVRYDGERKTLLDDLSREASYVGADLSGPVLRIVVDGTQSRWLVDALNRRSIEYRAMPTDDDPYGF